LRQIIIKVTRRRIKADPIAKWKLSENRGLNLKFL
jgi:hypothetical protein